MFFVETKKVPKNLDNSTLKKSFYWWRGDKLQYYMEVWGAGLSSVGTPKTKFLGYINITIWKAPHLILTTAIIIYIMLHM